MWPLRPRPARWPWWAAVSAPRRCFLLCKQLADAGCKPDLMVGFRDTTYGLDEFVPFCGKIDVATDTGALGHHGLVTDLLDPTAYNLVLTCGPGVMMRGVAKPLLCRPHPLPGQPGKQDGCGLGACLGCTCHTKVGPKTVCKDGPVFPRRGGV